MRLFYPPLLAAAAQGLPRSKGPGVLLRFLNSPRFDEQWITMNSARVLLSDDGEVLGGLGTGRQGSGKSIPSTLSDKKKKGIGSIGSDGKVVLPENFNSNTIFTVGTPGPSRLNMKYGQTDRRGATGLQNVVNKIIADDIISRDITVRYWQPRRKDRAQTFSISLPD